MPKQTVSFTLTQLTIERVEKAREKHNLSNIKASKSAFIEYLITKGLNDL